jgi:hypothetical protein
MKIFKNEDFGKKNEDFGKKNEDFHNDQRFS